MKERARLFLLLIWRLPTVAGAIAAFVVTGSVLEAPMASALAVALVFAVCLCTLGVEFPAVRGVFAFYVAGCSLLARNNSCPELRAACSSDIGNFTELFGREWELVSEWWVAAVGRTLVWVGGAMALITWLAVKVASSGHLSETAMIELGALIGTCIVVLLVYFEAPPQSPRRTKVLTALWVCILASLIFAAWPLFDEESCRRFSLCRDSHLFHASAVLSLNILLFIYDFVSLQGIRKTRTGESHGAYPKEAGELSEMCFLVDAPMALSLGGVVIYWYFRWTELGITGESFLAGAIVMQFVVSLLLFRTVRERIIARLLARQ